MEVGDVIYIDFPSKSFRWANGLKAIISIDHEKNELKFCDIDDKGRPKLNSSRSYMVAVTSISNFGIQKTDLKLKIK